MLEAATMDSPTRHIGTASSASCSNSQDDPPDDPNASTEQEEPHIEQFPGREHRPQRPLRMQSLLSRKQDLKRPLEKDSDLAAYIFPKGWQSSDLPGRPMMTTAKQLPELMKSLRSTGVDFTLLACDFWEFKARHQHRRIKELKHEEWDLGRLKSGKVSFFKGYYDPVGFKPHTGLYFIFLRKLLS